MNRRHFVKNFIPGFLATFAHVFANLKASDVSDDCDIARVLPFIIDDLATAKEIGWRYIHSLNEKPSLSGLVHAVTDPGHDQFFAVAGREDVSGYFKQRIRRDFEREKFIVLDGWYLSRTEVNLFAIAALV